MAAPSGQAANGIIWGINVTPLVDVMLVLLVIFIVTAKIIVTPAVPLDLPHAAHGEEVQVILSVIVPVRGPMLAFAATVTAILPSPVPALGERVIHVWSAVAAQLWLVFTLTVALCAVAASDKAVGLN